MIEKDQEKVTYERHPTRKCEEIVFVSRDFQTPLTTILDEVAKYQLPIENVLVVPSGNRSFSTEYDTITLMMYYDKKDMPKND